MAAVLLTGTLPFDFIALGADGVLHARTSQTKVKRARLIMVGHAVDRYKHDALIDSLGDKPFVSARKFAFLVSFRLTKLKARPFLDTPKYAC